MKLIQSQIIPASQNAYWEPLPEAWPTDPKPVLVVTLPYNAGSPEEQTLLRMLQACKLDESRYHIVQLPADGTAAWGQIKEILQPEQVLLSGILPAQLGISALLRLHAPNAFGGCTIIPTFSPAQLELEQAVKRELWTEALKPVFIYDF